MQIDETQATQENIFINLTTHAQHLENAQQTQNAANPEMLQTQKTKMEMFTADPKSAERLGHAR